MNTKASNNAAPAASRPKTDHSFGYVGTDRFETVRVRLDLHCAPGRGWFATEPSGLMSLSPLCLDQAALCDWINDHLSQLCVSCGRELRRTEGEGVCIDCQQTATAEDDELETALEESRCA